MKTKIKEVQDYFKAKLLAGEFEVIEQDGFTAKLRVDNEFDFIIWIGNRHIQDSRKNYSGGLSFMDLQFTDEESIILDAILNPIVVKYLNDILLKQKEEELIKLRCELGV